MSNAMVGVILAGGKGSRLRHVGTKIPKALLPVCNIPVLEYHLHAMEDVGIRDVYIIIGHLGHEIKEHLQTVSTPIRVHLIEQSSPRGIADALRLVKSTISAPMLVFLGDVFFSVSNMKSMVEEFVASDVDALLTIRDEDDLAIIKNNFTVELNGAGRVIRVIEKPTFINNNIKGCGLYAFKPSIFDAIDNTPCSALRNEYELTDAIQQLIDRGGIVRAESIVNWDMNITYEHDLMACNMRQLHSVLQKKCVIGKGCDIHDKAQIESAIIGDNVTILHPITLKNTLILKNSIVRRTNNCENVVITPETSIQC